jgi:membrane associated rhomboid family serine protease
MDQRQWQTPERSGPRAEPEILPPGTMPGDATYGPRQGYGPGYGEPVPMPPPRRRSGWELAPATYILTGINITVYVLMVLRGVSPTAPTGDQLVHWGANVGLFVLADHQWWRLVTSTFVHSGIIHIATNMWCLYNLGLLGEPLMGAFGVVAAYLLTGVVGNLLSVALHPGVVSGGHILDYGVISVGASGAVFGLAGVLIPLLGSKLLPVDRTEVARLRRSVISFAVLNFVIGFGADAFNSPIRIDNMAHLGGFLSGMLLGILLVPKLGTDRQLWIRRQWLAFGSVLLLVLLGAHFIANLWRG